MNRDDKKMISLEISPELKEALRFEAFKQNLTVSALIRKTLEETYKDTINSVKK